MTSYAPGYDPRMMRPSGPARTPWGLGAAPRPGVGGIDPFERYKQAMAAYRPTAQYGMGGAAGTMPRLPGVSPAVPVHGAPAPRPTAAPAPAPAPAGPGAGTWEMQDPRTQRTGPVSIPPLINMPPRPVMPFRDMPWTRTQGYGTSRGLFDLLRGGDWKNNIDFYRSLQRGSYR